MKFGHAAVQMNGSGSDLGMDYPLYAPRPITATIPGLGARADGLGLIRYKPNVALPFVWADLADGTSSTGVIPFYCSVENRDGDWVSVGVGSPPFIGACQRDGLMQVTFGGVTFNNLFNYNGGGYIPPFPIPMGVPIVLPVLP